MENKYFAALDQAKIGTELMRRVEDFYSLIRSSGVYKRVSKSYRAYYGMSISGGYENSFEITPDGEQDEFRRIRVNHYRNIAQHMLNMTTSQKFVPQPIAANSDSKSLKQATLACGLLEYYNRTKRLDRILRQAVEQAIVFGEAYIKTEWDPTLGSKYAVAPGTNKIIKDGDLKFSNVGPLDLIKDPHKESNADVDWLIVRHFENKFEVAARYPELSEKILSLETKNVSEQVRVRFGRSFETSEDIPVYEFYHRTSEAVPEGKYVEFLSADLITFFGPLPYEDVPVRRIVPGELMGSPYGYTAMYDLLALQEIVDMLYSVVATNQAAFGVQNIIAPKGHDLTPTQLAGALNLIEYDSKLGKPEALNLLNTPEEIFGFINQVEKVMETLSGVNSVARGDPQPSLESGSALALVQSQAIQFNSGLQQQASQLAEDVYTDAINIIKRYAKTKRIVSIVGKNQRHMVRAFDGDSFSEINRIAVEPGNALSRNISGRMQIAQDLINAGMISQPEQYLQIVKTGSLDPLTEGDQSELFLIRDENELLADGQFDQVISTAIDRHSLHIPEHRSLLGNMELRRDPKLVAGILAHIQEHIDDLRNTDPALLGMIGERSLMLPPQSPEEAAGGTPPAQDPEMFGQVNPADMGEAAPNMPQMPRNPLTGERASPEGM